MKLCKSKQIISKSHSVLSSVTKNGFKVSQGCGKRRLCGDFRDGCGENGAKSAAEGIPVGMEHMDEGKLLTSQNAEIQYFC